MNVESYGRVVELCDAAWALSPEARTAFLRDTCQNDHLLRREVEAMLDADRRAELFLRDPPFELVTAALASLDAPCKAGDMLGDYKIVGRLGAGGMAEVFLAQDMRLDRKVALKVLPGEF